MGTKNPTQWPGSWKRLAAFTATHAAMKTDVLRAENLFNMHVLIFLNATEPGGRIRKMAFCHTYI
jgi:hypothetical protein